MVALLGLFQSHEILVQHLLLGERDAVDAGHHGSLLVAAPVGSSQREQFERLDGRGGHEVRTLAEVDVVALCVSGNLAVLQLGNQLILIRLTLRREEFHHILL